MEEYFVDFHVIPHLFYRRAKEFSDKCKEAKNLIDEKEFAALSIILSILVIEAYINGYAACYVYDEKRKPQNEQCESGILKFLEDQKGSSLDNKLKVWTKIITGKTFNEAEELWGTYKYIRKLRGEIIHFKQEQAEVEIDNGIHFWKAKRYKDINKKNAEKAIKCVVNIIGKLHELRGWPKPKWVS